jgi:dipeptidyl aminopeptidase/acylaminoacyl peptidase
VLFTIGTRGSWDDAALAAQSLETGQRQVLIQGGSDPRYVPTGHLLYVRGGSLMAVAFDAVRLQVSGQPVPIIANVMQSLDGAAQFAISATGRSLVYVAGSGQGAERSLVWVDRHGVPQPLAAPPRAYDTPRLSPDGRTVIVTIEGERDSLWLYDVSAGSWRQLTSEGANSSPLWTPDGTRVTFSSTRTGPANLFWKRIDGGADERLTTAAHLQVPLSWSPDGRTLAFLEHDTVTARDVWTLALDGAGAPRPLLHSPANESGAVFSRDGRWLAYVSDESGGSEVYVTPFPGADRELRVSTDGGIEPVWGPDGGELFYRAGERMMTARVITTSGFRALSPTVLFEGAYERGHSQANFDVDRDGTRFLMVRAIERESLTRELQVVQEWFDELIRRVPPSR